MSKQELFKSLLRKANTFEDNEQENVQLDNNALLVEIRDLLKMMLPDDDPEMIEVDNEEASQVELMNPEDIPVSPAVQFPKVQDVNVINHPVSAEIPEIQKVEVTNPVDIPKVEIPKTIEVKKPSWFKTFQDNKIIQAIKGIGIGLDKLMDNIRDKTLGDAPEEAVHVVLVDSDKKGTYNASFQGGGVVFPEDGFISTNNSSTELLAGDAVFTGVGDDVSSYAVVKIFYKSDVAAALSGLSIQFSTDNVNWDVQLVGDLGAKTFQVHALIPAIRFFRIVYTNGSAAQGLFRLQCSFHVSGSPALITRAGQPQSTVDCTPTRLGADIDLDFARKHIPGGRAFFFFGFNDSMTSGVWEDVHPNSGDINWQTAATNLEAISTDAADDSDGAGTRQIEIHGLSATGVDQDEVLTLNGASATTTTPNSYIRVNKAHNENVGTYGGSHQGDITIRTANAGTLLMSKLTGREGSVDTSPQYGSGEAGNGYYTVPLNKVLYITRLEVTPNVKGSQTIDIVLYEREGILNTTAPQDPRRIIWSAVEIDKPVEKVFKSHIKIKSLTDLWFRAKPSGTNSKVSVSLDFYLVDADASGA